MIGYNTPDSVVKDMRLILVTNELAHYRKWSLLTCIRYRSPDSRCTCTVLLYIYVYTVSILQSTAWRLSLYEVSDCKRVAVFVALRTASQLVLRLNRHWCRLAFSADVYCFNCLQPLSIVIKGKGVVKVVHIRYERSWFRPPRSQRSGDDSN